RKRKKILMFAVLLSLMKETYIGVRQTENHDRNQDLRSGKYKPEFSVKLKIEWKYKISGQRPKNKSQITDNGIFKTLSCYYAHFFRYKVMGRKSALYRSINGDVYSLFNKNCCPFHQ